MQRQSKLKQLIQVYPYAGTLNFPLYKTFREINKKESEVLKQFVINIKRLRLQRKLSTCQNDLLRLLPFIRTMLRSFVIVD